MTGVTLEASLNGDVLNETLVQVPDGSVILVYLSDGFSETIQKDLQRFLDRQVNLFHLPPIILQVILMSVLKLLSFRDKLVLQASPSLATPCLRIGEVPYLPLHRSIIQGRKLPNLIFFRLM